MEGGRFEAKFLTFIEEHQLFNTSEKVLLAVSGGLDSVVMAHLFKKHQFKFAIAHCNFQLRGEESDKDETFVRELSKTLQVPFYSTTFNTEEKAAGMKASIQMVARDLRYDWLRFIKKEYNYHHISVAHHANDVAETMLLNLTRGSGLAGLHGILPKRDDIIRPLLFAPREEIFQYANEEKIKWREDASNASIKYQRNLIRHKVIPVLKEINPSLEESMFRSASFFNQVEEAQKQLIAETQASVQQIHGEISYFSIRRLLQLQPLDYYLYHFLADYGFNYQQLDQLEGTLESGPGKRFYSETHVIEVDRDHLLLYPVYLEHRRTNEITIKQEDRAVNFERFCYSIEIIDQQKDFPDLAKPHVAYLDADQVKFPLTIRHWQEGDRFYPLGMDQPKKLSDFFVDEKVSLPEKLQTHIFETGGKIIWLAGWRLDNRFKLRPDTRKVLRIERKSSD